VQIVQIFTGLVVVAIIYLNLFELMLIPILI